MSLRAARSPKILVMAVMAMTLVVLGLGGAVLALKLRPQPTPTTAVERDLAAWERAVAADPKSDSARTGLGLALLEAGRQDDARAAFEEAVRLNGKNWMAQFQLGLLLRDSDPARAVDLLDRSAQLAPRTSKVSALVAEGDLLMKMNQPERARGAYGRAITDAPFILEAHFGLGRALEALGDVKGALKEYREAATFDPSNQEVAEAIARLQGTG